MAPDQIKKLRIRLKMDKKTFAKLMNVSMNTIYRWERGAVPATSTALAVMQGIQEALFLYGTRVIVPLLQEVTPFGGISYLMIRLLETYQVAEE
jgi:DNA-binding XRE family transcriptional regulator